MFRLIISIIITLLLLLIPYAYADYQPAGSPDYYTRIAQGEIDGATAIFQFGSNPDIDTGSVPETIWDGSALYTWSSFTDADITDIVSSNNADNHMIAVFGLDVNYERVVNYPILNGQTKVTLATPMLRVCSMVNVSATNVAGDIYLITSGAAITLGVPDDITTVRAKIRGVDGYQNTQMAMYTIPACHNGYVVGGFNGFATKGDAGAIVEVWARLYGGVFTLQGTIPVSSAGGLVQTPFELPLKLPPKTDFEGRVVDTTANDISILGATKYWIERIPGCTP